MDKSKCNHLKSIGQKIPDESLTTRYIIQDPNSNGSDKTLRKSINIYNKKFERILVSCVSKLLTKIRWNRKNKKFTLYYFFYPLKIQFYLELIMIDINFLKYMKCVLPLVVLLEL